MALLEFFCEACNFRFEQITSEDDSERGKCPKCQGKGTRKLISRFVVAGRGDLRESTFHGCHDVDVPLKEEASPDCHDHGHDDSGSD